MKTIITEEMIYRQKVVEYTIKCCNNAKQQEDATLVEIKFRDGEKNMMGLLSL